MTLRPYIRKEQNFNIYIYKSEASWEVYDSSVHGQADSIIQNYVVAYKNGEIIENTVCDSNSLPPNTYYVKTIPYKSIRMPFCVDSDPRVLIKHEPSRYHEDEHYCTRLCNTGDVPFKVRRFAAFAKAGLFRGYLLSTISNDWFSHEQFTNWYNVKSEWVEPQCEVADHDNYGAGKAYWVFEIEFQGHDTVYMKSKMPRF